MAWHADWTSHDAYRRQENVLPLLAFYQRLTSNPRNLWLAYADLLYTRTERPRWFVDSELAETLMRTRIPDMSLEQINVPYDSFALVFERGTKLPCGVPLRWIRLTVARSKIAQPVAVELGAVLENNFTLQVDCGQSEMATRQGRLECDENRPFYESNYFFKTAQCNCPDQLDFKEPIPELDNIISQSMHIAIGAVLMYCARPETIVEHTLPRSERYQQHGERRHIRRMKMPTVKVIRPRSTTEVTGPRRAHHFRAGSLHTLRAARFTRNLDGTPRVIWVPPCEIHAEETSLDDVA